MSLTEFTYRRYKFKRFLKLDDPEAVQRHLYILKWLKPAYTFGDKVCADIYQQPYSNIVNLKMWFQELNDPDTYVDAFVSIMETMFSVEKSDVMNADIIDLFAAFNRVSFLLNELIEREDNTLPVAPDPKMVEAGLDRLEKFGELNRIDSLAGGDLTKWKDVEQMPYQEVYAKMYMDAEHARIQKAYIEITKPKTTKRKI